MKKKKRTSIYTPGDYQFKVGKAVTGKGLFTLTEIPRGKCVIEYIGKPISEEEASRKSGRYLFSIGKNKTIDGNIKKNTARYINHSCRPNCEAIGPNGHVYIFSTRRIKPGEELTYHYGKEYFDEYIRPVGCKCAKCSPKLHRKAV
jgi:SET domain-containing protein